MRFDKINIKLCKEVFALKFLAVLIVLIIGAYKIALNVVRYRSANNPTPECVSDVYDAETYKKWKKYGAEHSVLSIISDAAT